MSENKSLFIEKLDALLSASQIENIKEFADYIGVSDRSIYIWKRDGLKEPSITFLNNVDKLKLDKTKIYYKYDLTSNDFLSKTSLEQFKEKLTTIRFEKSDFVGQYYLSYYNYFNIDAFSSVTETSTDLLKEYKIELKEDSIGNLSINFDGNILDKSFNQTSVKTNNQLIINFKFKDCVSVFTLSLHRFIIKVESKDLDNHKYLNKSYFTGYIIGIDKYSKHRCSKCIITPKKLETSSKHFLLHNRTLSFDTTYRNIIDRSFSSSESLTKQDILFNLKTLADYFYSSTQNLKTLLKEKDNQNMIYDFLLEEVKSVKQISEHISLQRNFFQGDPLKTGEVFLNSVQGYSNGCYLLTTPTSKNSVFCNNDYFLKKDKIDATCNCFDAKEIKDWTISTKKINLLDYKFYIENFLYKYDYRLYKSVNYHRATKKLFKKNEYFRLERIYVVKNKNLFLDISDKIFELLKYFSQNVRILLYVPHKIQKNKYQEFAITKEFNFGAFALNDEIKVKSVVTSDREKINDMYRNFCDIERDSNTLVLNRNNFIQIKKEIANYPDKTLLDIILNIKKQSQNIF
jgi:hypothetical protein